MKMEIVLVQYIGIIKGKRLRNILKSNLLFYLNEIIGNRQLFLEFLFRNDKLTANKLKRELRFSTIKDNGRKSKFELNK